MKITIPLTSESMTAEEYIEDANNACDLVIDRLNKIFNEDYTVVVRKPSTKSGILGGAIYVSLYNVPVGSTELQLMNAEIGIRAIMHLTDNSGKQKDCDAFSWELLTGGGLKKNGMSFRKINGKSPTDCCVKLIAWFKKNEAAIKAAEKYVSR